MSKIAEAFSHGKAFIPFITCGDPDLETTAAAVRAAVDNGADLIELGIPFSDPTAEGPVIQGANLRALNGGVTTDRIFGLVRDLRRYGVALISLIAPTSEDRIAMIAREAEGFLYVVSSLGVTGTRSEIKTDLASMVETVRLNTKIPAAIGFGISTPEQAKKMAETADGVIVGSAIVKLLEQYGTDAPRYIGAYVKAMKAAIE